jgi:IS30 family transposase
LIIGKNNASAIGTLVERQTRYVLLVHLPNGYKAEQARDGLIATIKTLPPPAPIVDVGSGSRDGTTRRDQIRD